MNEETVRWIIAGVGSTLLAYLVGLTKLYMDHIKECRQFREVIIRIDTNVNRILTDIGSDETGIRGALRRHEVLLAKHELRLRQLDGES